MMQEQLSQALSLADVFNYATVTNVSMNTLGIDMSRFKRALWLITGVGIGAAGTIDGRLQSALNSNFNVLHNITGSNITQITANGVMATVEVRADQVTQQNTGDRYVRLQGTGGGNPVTFAMVGFGSEAVQKPGGVGATTVNTVGGNDLGAGYIGSRVVT